MEVDFLFADIAGIFWGLDVSDGPSEGFGEIGGESAGVADAWVVLPFFVAGRASDVGVDGVGVCHRLADLEAGYISAHCDLDGSVSFSVSVLCDVYSGSVFSFADEPDVVGVVADGARLAEPALFVELGCCGKGEVELQGDSFEAAGDFGDVLFSGLVGVHVAEVDELDVIDDDEVGSALARELTDSAFDAVDIGVARLDLDVHAGDV